MYRIKDELRKELSKAVGEIISPKTISMIKGKLVVIGDIAVLTFYEHGIVPDVAIVDFKTKREECSNLREKINSVKTKTISVKNPGGCITDEAMNIIKSAINGNEKIRIVVDGEEDLLALPCILFAEKNTKIVYGLPDHGLMLIDVNDKIKDMTRKVMNRMVYDNGSGNNLCTG